MPEIERLHEINDDAWNKLADAVGDVGSPLRYLTFCTIGLDGNPKARILVLRAVRTGARELEFYTDIRSGKWQELARKSATTVIGFSPLDRLQVRLEGHATIHHPGSQRNLEAWDLLSTWIRRTYCGGPPGDALAFPPDETLDNADEQAPTPEMTEPGRSVFGVVSFRAVSMDWFALTRQGSRRAMFRYEHNTADFASSWVNP